MIELRYIVTESLPSSLTHWPCCD